MDKEEQIFDIKVDHAGKTYQGWVNPSSKMNAEGKPVSFHVVLENVSFGYLSFHECKWTIDEQRPDVLVEKVAKEIESHYAF